MFDIVVKVVLFLVIVCAAAYSMYRNRPQDMLNAWLEMEKFELIRSKRRFWNSPFPYHHSQIIGVYEVTVKDRSGAIRDGWVRFRMVGKYHEIDLLWNNTLSPLK
jgi:hypothetical protein